MAQQEILPAQPRRLTRKQTSALRERSRAFALCRVSTDEQALEGVSLGAQQDAVRTEASRRGLSLVDIVTEAGVSAKTTDARKRPQLDDVLRRLRAGEADALIVQRLDRLSRSMLGTMPILASADDEGWSLIVISPSLDSAKPADRVLFHVMALIAEQERSLIVARTTEGMKRARDDGAVLGRPRMPRETAAHILALVDGEQLSYAESARRLDDAQIPTPRGAKYWHVSTVMRAHAQLTGRNLDAVKWRGRHGESEAEAIARLARATDAPTGQA